MRSKFPRTEWGLARLCNLVRGSHWSGVIKPEDLRPLVLEGHICSRELCDLNSFLKMHTDENKKSHPRRLEDLASDWPIDRLRNARRGMWVLFEGHPLLREMDAYIAERAQPAGEKYSTYKARSRRYSIVPGELPPTWQEALERMREGMPGCLIKGTSQACPAPSIQVTIRTKLCEFAFVAREAGLPVEMSVEAATAYEMALFRREKPLSPVTIKSAMRSIKDFARYLGAPEAVVTHLQNRVRYNENRANNYIPMKEAKVLALPSYEGIFGKAFDLLGDSANEKGAKQAQFKRNAAVAITLFSAIPLRVADTGLRFGKEITWDGSLYKFNLVMSKSSRQFVAPILPEFGFFIDQMILQGASNEYLDELREACFRARRPLFVTYDGREPHQRYVSHLWKQVLGTGSHAARTKLHDEFGRLGSRGVELAMRACGQRSEKTAEAYRTRAFSILAKEKAHYDIAGAISDAEWKEFFGKGMA